MLQNWLTLQKVIALESLTIHLSHILFIWSRNKARLQSSSSYREEERENEGIGKEMS